MIEKADRKVSLDLYEQVKWERDVAIQHCDQAIDWTEGE